MQNQRNYIEKEKRRRSGKRYVKSDSVKSTEKERIDTINDIQTAIAVIQDAVASGRYEEIRETIEDIEPEIVYDSMTKHSGDVPENRYRKISRTKGAFYAN